MVRFLLAVSMLWSGVSSAAGTSVYDFLNIPSGARAVGMGTAFTALANDPGGIWWNPAGGVNNGTREVSLEYNPYFAGMKKGSVGYLNPLGTHNCFAAGVTYLSVGEMIKTNREGDELGTFSPLFMAASAGYSVAVMDKPEIMIGAAVKCIYASIDEYTSYGAAIDLGTLYKPGIKGVTVGVSAQNIGSQIKEFNEEKESLPFNVAIGGSYVLGDDELYLTLDLKKPLDHGLTFALGSEWIASEIFTLRLGYNELWSDWSEMILVDGISFGGVSLGFGLTWKRLRFDLSAAPMINVGNPLWICTSYSL